MTPVPLRLLSIIALLVLATSVPARPDDSFLQYIEHSREGFGNFNGRGFVTMSPDGANLYVNGYRSVAVFARDAYTGSVTLVETQQGGLGGIPGLENPESIAVAPDGAHVYVTSSRLLNSPPLSILQYSLVAFSRTPRLSGIHSRTDSSR